MIILEENTKVRRYVSADRFCALLLHAQMSIRILMNLVWGRGEITSFREVGAGVYTQR